MQVTPSNNKDYKIGAAVLFVIIIAGLGFYAYFVAVNGYIHPQQIVLTTKGLIALWTFKESEGEDRHSIGTYKYTLREDGGPIARVKEGVFGPYSAFLTPGKRFYIPRHECPELNIFGKAHNELSVVAWVKRMPYCGFKNYTNPKPCCEFIAGMFDESLNHRQYGLFLNLRNYNSTDEVTGLISDNGGDTPRHKGCVTGAYGKTKVPYWKWSCVAMTYDSRWIKSYLDGKLDVRPNLNPFNFTNGIFDGGKTGANFTVGGNNAFGEKHNYFYGYISGLAVFKTALHDEQIHAMCNGIYEIHKNRMFSSKFGLYKNANHTYINNINNDYNSDENEDIDKDNDKGKNEDENDEDEDDSYEREDDKDVDDNNNVIIDDNLMTGMFDLQDDDNDDDDFWDDSDKNKDADDDDDSDDDDR